MTITIVLDMKNNLRFTVDEFVFVWVYGAQNSEWTSQKWVEHWRACMHTHTSNNFENNDCKSGAS